MVRGRPLRMGLGRASTDVGTDLTVLPPVGTGRHMSASSDDAGPERGEFGTCAVKDALDLPSITVDDAAKETRRRSRLDGGRVRSHEVQARPAGHLMLAGKRQD
jgi:hypothetical protein